MEKETTPEQETRETLKLLAKTITMCLPEGYGFFLMVYEHNSDGRANYISNSQREDVIKSMKEFMERTENAWAVDKYEGEFGQGRKDG